MSPTHKLASFRAPVAAALARLAAVLAVVALAVAAAPLPERWVHAPASHPAFIVRVTGQGQPMILIPGLASSGTTWTGTVAHFDHQYRCYVLTLAGFAGVAPISEPLLPTVRQELVAYIRRHHLVRPVIVGHSLGGSIALDLAARYPRLVGPVVIVDSLPFFAGAWFGAPNLAAAQPMIARMRAGMDGMNHRQWLAYSRSGASTRSLASKPADQRRLVRWSLASDQRTVTDALLALVSTDLRPELPRIQSRVLVLGTWIGLGHGITRAEAMQVFHQQYRGVRRLTFRMNDQSRHFIMWDQPQWFYGQLARFLRAAPAQD